MPYQERISNRPLPKSMKTPLPWAFSLWTSFASKPDANRPKEGYAAALVDLEEAELIYQTGREHPYPVQEVLQSERCSYREEVIHHVRARRVGYGDVEEAPTTEHHGEVANVRHPALEAEKVGEMMVSKLDCVALGLEHLHLPIASKPDVACIHHRDLEPSKHCVVDFFKGSFHACIPPILRQLVAPEPSKSELSQMEAA